jgi:uncharacterized membrane protein
MEEPAEAKLYQQVRWTLLGGMALSFALMGLGLLGLLWDPAAAARAATVAPLATLPAALGAGDPAAFLDAGVLTLLLIPLAHLTVAVAHFARARQWRDVAAGAIVLALLGLGAALAFIPH